jgi:hypothetical protein
VARTRRAFAFTAVLGASLVAFLAAAPLALAADGEGLAGRIGDQTITFFCFGVILFFPVLVAVLSLIQGRLEANKDRRRYELKRLGELD